MLEIYGVNLSQLPDKRTLTSMLEDSFYIPWKENHRMIRDEKTARASLAGLLLLQRSGKRGNLNYDACGRPYFAETELDFNITHTDQQVFCAIETPETCPQMGDACAVSDYPCAQVAPGRVKHLFEGKCRVGIDAEDLNRIAHVRICPLAERWFSENELDFFLSAPTDYNFLRVWTRKEALIKWTGEGMRSLQEADTTLAESMYGIRFFEYRVNRTVVTLCSHRTSLPPLSIHMLTNSELLF